ncbi:MAG: glycosyltransferase family 2 protein [Chloroflexota bacterium]|nr:MAG: glycosyltransferase family 2 protein [Chloroflexota bacterium]
MGNLGVGSRPGGPLASSCVCTHNRAELLNAMLPHLLAQRVPQGVHEVIVVDNASTDDTRRIVQHWQRSYANLRYVSEASLGIAVARNTALANSQARYILFFDDDCFASPGCVESLLQPFRSMQPRPSAVMGKIQLLWDGGRPRWYPPKYETLLGRFDFGDAARWLDPNEYLLTMAVAFDRQTLVEVGGFRPDMSHRGRAMVYGDDTEVHGRLLRQGARVYYEPRAQASHWVSKVRQNKAWLVKRLYGDGLSQVLLQRYELSRTQQTRMILYDLRQSMEACGRWLRAALQSREEDKQESLFFLAQRLGRLVMRVQLLGNASFRVPTE